MRLSFAFAIDSVEFTSGIVAGDVSLGGSESACLGLARALQARGHDVHIFTTKLDQTVPPIDHAGVAWHDQQTLAQWALLKDFDVLVALRQPAPLQIRAKFRVLWTQDLLADETMKNYVVSLAWAYDAIAYVSSYHRKQWEGRCPELAPLGWVTRNGFDPALVPTDVTKDPNRVIHISRPERGMQPLLRLWPMLKAVRPHATLQLCRYSSMYDKDGWGKVCAAFDQEVQRVHAEVGGITYLGELGKPALYQAIADAAVMWYPGVSDFAETSCIAAIESQACGTPFVGSYKGALPETVPAGALIPGVAESDPQYAEQAIAAVVGALDGCRAQTRAYRDVRQAGRAHVQAYTYAAIAGEWEAWLLAQFAARYEAQKPAILQRLIHDDDFVTAQIVATELGDASALAQCALVMKGDLVTPQDYATHAMAPLDELTRGDQRITAVVDQLTGCKHVLDAACGSGAFALALAQADPARHVTAVDYSEGNIAAGQAAADVLGVADQITWICAPIWDFSAQGPSPWLTSLAPQVFDGVWCGEFLEHVIDAPAVVRHLSAAATPLARMVFSIPMGPLHNWAPRTMAIQRTHVHHFRPADLDAIFGGMDSFSCLIMRWLSPDGRGELVGNWLVSVRNAGPIGDRPFDRRRLLRPYYRLSAGLITNDATDLRRCLESIWALCDEIVIGDCGCAPGDLDRILVEYPRKVRVIPVGTVSDLPGGFSEARNRVLAATTGDWFLWIDSDEILCGAMDLGKYLDGAFFRGYVIPQNHLHLDASMTTDTPVRVFRKGVDIQFYGCVHEQPQQGDCNGEIQPGLQLADVQIAHTGYLHEGIRRQKCLSRNLPLLVRDRQQFPARELGHLLVLRDYANLSLWAKEQNGGHLTAAAEKYYGQVVALFEAHFMDPDHKYHALARPFYEQALRHIDGAIEVEVGMMAGPGGFGQHRLRSKRVWVRKPEHARALIQKSTDQMLTPIEQPFAFDVEPIVATTVDEPVYAVPA